MNIFKTTLAIGALCAATVLPTLAQDAPTTPNGTFVDSYGTSFQFTPCGEAGQDLCGTLTNLEGKSATPENLAYVGQQVMQAEQVAPNQWKGSLSAGGISAEATVTLVSSDTVEIQGCRAGILCQTLSYTKNS